MEAIVCSQFPDVAALGEAAEHATGSIEALAATEAFGAAVAQFATLTDKHIGGAVLFALIGFCLVTGIEMAGKIIGNKKHIK